MGTGNSPLPSSALLTGSGTGVASGAEGEPGPKRMRVGDGENVVVDGGARMPVKIEKRSYGQLFDGPGDNTDEGCHGKKAKLGIKLEHDEKESAEESGIEIDVSDDNLIKIINLVNEKAREKKEEGSNNCEVQAARVVCALQGKDCSEVSMSNEGIQYELSHNAWGCLRDSDMVQSNYRGLIESTIVNDITGRVEVVDLSGEKCVTDVMDKNAANRYFEQIKQEQRNWGLIGLELEDGWHQAVWIKREKDIVICDPNRGGGNLTTLESYRNLNRVSILKFAKRYRPDEAHVQKKQRYIDR